MGFRRYETVQLQVNARYNGPACRNVPAGEGGHYVKLTMMTDRPAGELCQLKSADGPAAGESKNT